MLEIGTEIEGEITSIAFGGEGIMRFEGFVVFIPFTLVGERVRIKITSAHRSYARGELIELLTPSPERIEARCPHFGRCGGCQFQNLKMDSQLQIKEQLLHEALVRNGGISNPKISRIIAADDKWEYRRHITLHLEEHQGQCRPSFVALDNKTQLPIDECSIFEDKSSPLWPSLDVLIAAISFSEPLKGRVGVFKRSKSQWIVHLQFEKFQKEGSEAIKSFLINNQDIVGVIVSTPKSVKHFGDTDIPFAVDTWQFVASPLAFMQNHHEQSTKIYRYILDLAKELKISKALDLYCGIGIASVMLASYGINVVGVEYSPEAVKLAKINADRNPSANAELRPRSIPKFIQGDVEKVLHGLLKREKPELLIINPPRSGASAKTIQQILHHSPHDVIYISCMPATLARDLKALCKETYSLQSIQPYDMFPQTTHLETVVHLRKNKGRV